MSVFQGKDSKGNGRWTKAQHEKFLLGLELYGKNWKKIEEIVATRTGSQIRSHAQKFFLKSKKADQPLDNSQMGHSTSDCGQPLAVISKSIAEGLESSSHSYFMDQIIKYSPHPHTLDFWGLFIDDSSSNKPERKQHVGNKNFNSTFEGVNELKGETGISEMDILKGPIA